MEGVRVRRVIQCVPNFSEGRRTEIVERIVDAIKSAAPVKVIDYSMDPDHNRSVITFLGEPEDIRVSILAGVRLAIDLIDLNKHEGEHPRIGAADVIPVVPIVGVSMEEAVQLGHAIGRDIAEELEVPVYYYEECALRDRCKNLADIRKGGFEALKVGGLVGDRAPDVGPSRVHPTAGATVVGARGPLIAYNVNLATDDVAVARRIAAKIRALRDSGQGMAGVKAIGVYLKSRGIAQVSTNITRPHLIGLWEVYSFVEREARAEGVEVLESELIGSLRLEAVVDALRSAIKCENLTQTRVIEHQLLPW